MDLTPELLRGVVASGPFAVMFYALGRYMLSVWKEDRLNASEERRAHRELEARTIEVIAKNNVLLEKLTQDKD